MASIKSMHVGSRKKELQRIEKENYKIAQKIFSIQPSVNAHELESQFKDHKSLSEGLRKIKRRKIFKN